MAHCDPDVLALAALGEELSHPADVEHLSGCLECRREVESLSATVRVARVGSGPLETPPDRVWQGVRAQIAATDQPASLAARRGRPRWLGAVAVAAAIVAIAGSFAIGRSLAQGPAPTTVAMASLTPLPGEPATASGSAVLQRRDGSYTVEVDTTGLGTPQGFFEVWLMSPDDSGLVSLGTMSAGQTRATFPVPDGLPLTVYTNVDISDEPIDGNPGHSAVSILRGQFSV